MKKIMSIFGTRPEAIKMAPILHLAQKDSTLESLVCVSAQHREMLDGVLRTFAITPDYDLNIMRHGQTLQSITSRILEQLTPVLEKERPDMVLVHGDTTTTFAAALCAFYLQIPLGHVEAGLRTYQRYSPFPEEINRQLVSRLSTLHFAPTKTSAQNLREEGICEEAITVTGNTAIDALQLTKDEHYSHPALAWANGRRIVLLTAHRRENQQGGLARIFTAVKTLCQRFPDICVIFPCHKNPKIRALAHQMLGDCPQVLLIEPLEVYDFHNMIRHSYLILTDSGGIQEEAPSLGKPVLVLRDTTERPEGVAAGTLRLVGSEEKCIVQTAQTLLADESAYAAMSSIANPYGDGHASERILAAIHDYFAKVQG